jgi:2-octaprenyl-6-methoxyphenol hydroxylase
MTKKHYDIVIVGGGMVGASTAIALSGHNLNIALIEAFPFRSPGQPSYDSRTVALAYGSRKILETLGVWQSLKTDATLIKQIHISDRGHFGTTRLQAAKQKVPALGYVVENRNLGKAFLERLQALSDVTIFCPASMQSLQQNKDQASIEIEHEGTTETLTAKLIIAADGGNSKVRQLLNIDCSKKDYDQSAVITTVSTSAPHEHIAYERFTSSGPLALLPMSDNRYSLVFTVNPEEAQQLIAMPDGPFLKILQERFGYRRGEFIKTAKRIAYPLSLIKAQRSIDHRIVLIGNASHTLHPVAGQGFNLGIRDVATLAEVIVQAANAGRDIGQQEVLQEYEQWRQRDHNATIQLTDNLISIFSNHFFPLGVSRSKALGLLNSTALGKSLLTKQTMGLRGRLPRLSRGLRLR